MKKIKLEANPKEMALHKMRRTGENKGNKDLVEAVSNNAPIVPDMFTYGVGVNYAPSVRWEEVRIPSREKESVGQRDKINFELEDDAVADFSTGAVTMDVTCVQNTGTGHTPDAPTTFDLDIQGTTGTSGILKYTSPYTGKSREWQVLPTTTDTEIIALIVGSTVWKDHPVVGSKLTDAFAAGAGTPLSGSPTLTISGDILNQMEDLYGTPTVDDWVNHIKVVWQQGISVPLSLTNGFNNYCRLENGIWNIIDRLESRWSSEETEDLRKFNRLMNWQMFTQKDVRWEGIQGRFLYGVGDKITRNVYGREIKRYVMPIWTNFLDNNVAPLKYLPKQGRFQFHTNSAAFTMESNNTANVRPTFSVTNSELLFRKYMLNTNDSFHTEFVKELSEQPASVKYTSANDSNTTIEAGATKFQFDISEKSKSSSKILVFFSKVSIEQGFTINDKNQTWERLDLSETQLKYNTDLIPRQPSEVNDAEAGWNYFKWLDEHKISSGAHGTIGNPDFFTSKFHWCHDMEAFPHTGIMSGMDTTESYSQLKPEYRFAAPVPEKMNVNCWLISNAILPYNASQKRII